MLKDTSHTMMRLSFCADSPESLPYEPTVFWSVVVLNLCWQFTNAFSLMGVIWGLLFSVIPMLSQALVLHLILKSRNILERFFKIYMALQGVNVVIAMVVFLAVYLIPPASFALAIAGVAWQLVAMTHIVQVGLDCTRMQALGLVLLMLVCVYIITMMCFMMVAVVLPMPWDPFANA